MFYCSWKISLTFAWCFTNTSMMSLWDFSAARCKGVRKLCERQRSRSHYWIWYTIIKTPSANPNNATDSLFVLLIDVGSFPEQQFTDLFPLGIGWRGGTVLSKTITETSFIHLKIYKNLFSLEGLCLIVAFTGVWISAMFWTSSIVAHSIGFNSCKYAFIQSLCWAFKKIVIINKKIFPEKDLEWN